jgi:hypothetical protein
VFGEGVLTANRQHADALGSLLVQLDATCNLRVADSWVVLCLHSAVVLISLVWLPDDHLCVSTSTYARGSACQLGQTHSSLGVCVSCL